MAVLSRRSVSAGLAAAIGLTLAGCSDSEEKQAEELRKFLQTRVLDRQGVGVPKPNEDERKTFGRFAADYDIILKFNETMNASVNSKISDVIRRGSFTRVQDVIDRKADIVTARDAMRAMAVAMDGAIKDAASQKDALKQPDVLKAAYDKTFDRLITTPADVMRGVFPAAENVFSQSLEFADFLSANKADFKFNGPLVETSKPMLLNEFNRRAKAMQETGAGLMEAQRKLQALVRRP
jgi:hypothetical protein